MSLARDQLSARLGIVETYTDFHKQIVRTGPDTQRALLRALGAPAETEAEARDHLATLDREEARALPICQTLCAEEAATVPCTATGDWRLTLETGDVLTGETIGAGLDLPPLPVGIHHLQVNDVACHVLAHPRLAPSLPALTGRDKVWGVTGAIYALASRRNAGLGDYRDLADAARALGGHGAAFLGINPVHAIGTAADPGLISPYSPSHRAFLNTWHIALDDLERFGGVNAAPSGSTTDGLIDYPAAHTAREAALQAAWSIARERLPQDFAAFCDQAGAPLRQFARFEAISEIHGDDWRNWPAALRLNEEKDQANFGPDAKDRIAYHSWLQWIARTQLDAAQAAARDGGMALGLYLDYAVGARPGGAETWLGGQSHLTGVSLGAPPDPVSLDGQKWGLAPLSPTGLRRTGYAAFAALLRGVMSHCGMIRIDHVLGFYRAFLIPEDGSPGAYVRYPFTEMLAVVAIEAHKSGCLVVGEDLGLVPKGFRETLAERGIYGLDIAQFWMDDAQADLPPKAFRPRAIAGVGTHDTPTLAGYVTGADLKNLAGIGLMTDAEAETALAKRRPVAESQIGPRQKALHQQLAQGASALVALQFDDITTEVLQQNVPGTIDEHPNWRHRHRIAVEDMANSPELALEAAHMRKAGRCGAQDAGE